MKMRRFQLYCLFSVLLSASAIQTNDSSTYTGKVVPHSVVVPRRIDSDGKHVSFDLSRFHNDPHIQSQQLYYKLSLEQEDLTVVLNPSREFIAPHLIVEHRRPQQYTRKHYNKLTNVHINKENENEPLSRNKRELSAEESSKRLATHCHYKGYVLGHKNSEVALSLCDGMVGLIRTEAHGDFWVEPVKEPHSSNLRKHVVFKRSTTIPDSKKRKRRRKRKHEKNCGTRQPRREHHAELQVEWKHQQGKVKIKERGRSAKSKLKRSVSRERHVEALVVADTSMMRFHEDGYVETYILTIMNMVASLYRDPSIGNLVNVVVVNIILLEDETEQEGLNVTVNADRTLESFCKWQSLQNYEEEDHPNHHDVAILITREDICARQDMPCGTLGVAHVGGMCQQDRSCNVNEDNGITLAHTIAHELGHNFGMYHDTEKIGCSRKEGKTQHVMTPSFEADTVEVAWSACSRRDITNFLDNGQGKCLEDEPSGHNFTYPELPAGAMYDAEYQCQLQFGSKGAQVCSPLSEICHRLWCVVDGLCTTMLKPAAPGTSCGKHMWCQNQQCVPIGDSPEPINGGWSDWGEWNECSRTCGAGVSTQERFCNHPTPAHSGRFCVGERRRHKICNTEPCLDGSTSFRAMQCASLNDQALHGVHGSKYKWIPYFDNDLCSLYCADANDTIIVPLGITALDGTPCRVGTRDMCIRGACKHVGCDWVIDSDSQEDSCGVCHGNGDQCDTFSGVYDKEHGSGYEVVASIPPGARNIHIEESSSSKNYIGIGSEASEEFFLNGKLEITISGEYTIGGTPGLYERDNEEERVHIPGPLREGVIVYVIYRGKYKNPGVTYNYTVSKVNVKTARQYEWGFSEWSVCSATCGTGVQTAQPICKESNAGVVHSEKCHPQHRPENKMRVCNTHPCPTRWWTGPWQLCSSTCGNPMFTLRKRTVLCVERIEEETTKVMTLPNIRPHGGIEYFEANDRRYTGQELALPDADCDGQEKPVEFEPCPDLPPCAEPVIITSEGIPPLDNDFTDYKLGFGELSQSYPREKFERKALPATPKKIVPKKNNKRKKKKDRVKKIRHEDTELDLMFRKGANYKHMKGHALKNMRYNSHIGRAAGQSHVL